MFFLCVNGVHIQNLSYRCQDNSTEFVLSFHYVGPMYWNQVTPSLQTRAFFTEISGQTYMTSNNSGNTVFPSMWVIWISPLWWVPCSPIPYSINICSAFLRGDWLSFYNNKHPWNRLVFITPTELWV